MGVTVSARSLILCLPLVLLHCKMHTETTAWFMYVASSRTPVCDLLELCKVLDVDCASLWCCVAVQIHLFLPKSRLYCPWCSFVRQSVNLYLQSVQETHFQPCSLQQLAAIYSIYYFVAALHVPFPRDSFLGGSHIEAQLRFHEIFVSTCRLHTPYRCLLVASSD